MGATVVAAAPVPEATTVEIHCIEVARGIDVRRLVLRRYAVPEYLAEWVERPAHEATVLERLAATPVPAPTLVAVDPNGDGCDVPAVLMSAIPGAVDQDAAASAVGCPAMAVALVRIHGVDPGDGVARRYLPFHAGHDVSIPAWAADRGPWREAISLPLPPGVAGFIHRDFHPGNILWDGDALRGVVDWGEACRGPAGVDVGHCRVNLALGHGPEAADRFATAYERAGGAYDPAWDVVAAIDLLPHYDGGEALAAWPGTERAVERRRRLEAFVVAALAAR